MSHQGESDIAVYAAHAFEEELEVLGEFLILGLVNIRKYQLCLLVGGEEVLSEVVYAVYLLAFDLSADVSKKILFAAELDIVDKN